MMSQTTSQTLLPRLLLAFLMPLLLLSCDGSEIPSGSTSELGCEAYRGQVLKGVFRHPGDAPSAGEWAIFQLPMDSTTVNYTLGDSKPQQAIFECNDGQFKVIDSLAPTEAIAMQVQSFDKFTDLHLPSLGGIYTFVPVGQLEAVCPLDYSPVCAVETLESDDFCDADCPFGKLKTYGNACSAEAQGALITQKAECGEKEGLVYIAD